MKTLWPWLSSCALFFSAATLGGPAQAQQGPVDEIVVTATRLDPQKLREQAVDFVRRSGVAPGQMQAARWLAAVCPKVIGLSAKQAVVVEQRLRTIAAATGIRTGGVNCRNNITLVFTSAAQQVIDHIFARKPQSLSGLSISRRGQLRTDQVPVRWWHSSSVHDRDGTPENSISAPWVGIEGSAGGLPIGDNVTSTQQYGGGSNIRAPTIRGLSSATVIIDLSETGDATLEMLTDYAAMVTLAEVEPGQPPAGSILSLFESAVPPPSLTDWDLSLLRALYRMPLDRRSRIQRGHLVNALVAERSALRSPQERR